MTAGTMICEVVVSSDGPELPGTLALPMRCTGAVVFAHGSGSSRLSPRNAAVAGTLVARGAATLLFDLLTEAEAGDRRNVFDIALLGARVRAAHRRLREHDAIGDLPIGYFGASTGAAAALVAAADDADGVAAVVSRGGRPDLAGAALPRVTAPTLLIVGARDAAVLDLNRQALRRLRCERRLELIEGASHLFEEPGTLELVGDLAGAWFEEKFAGQATERRSDEATEGWRGGRA